MLYDDVWLLDGVRTGFADYNGTLKDVSPTDLGIKVASALISRTGFNPHGIDGVIGANAAQSSFDAYFFSRHVGIYAGLPIDVPAYLVHRLCCSGFDAIAQAADAITLGKGQAFLCVGAESMSRNPVAAYGHRSGFRMGQIDFRDFLWESTLDTAVDMRMGDTAEALVRKYDISREQADAFAAQSFERAVSAGEFLSGEIVAVTSETFVRDQFASRQIRLPRGIAAHGKDEHVRPTPLDTLSRLSPAFGGVQTGGNSSAIVDGAAACLVVQGAAAPSRQKLARIVAVSAVGVPPDIMGIGPVPAIRAVVEKAGLSLEQVDRFEINEAFAAQYLAVEAELELDRGKVNVNGGAIAIGHPLAVSGLRLTLTLARELRRSHLRYGIATACAGGGQGVAILIENPDRV